MSFADCGTLMAFRFVESFLFDHFELFRLFCLLLQILDVPLDGRDKFVHALDFDFFSEKLESWRNHLHTALTFDSVEAENSKFLGTLHVWTNYKSISLVAELYPV